MGASDGEIVIGIEAISETDRWRVSYRRADDDAPFREDILASADDGAVMIETTEFDRDALTIYDPPLTLMPPSLNPGEPFEQEVSMVVHPPNDRDTVKRRVRARGGAAVDRRRPGAQPVRSGSGAGARRKRDGTLVCARSQRRRLHCGALRRDAVHLWCGVIDARPSLDLALQRLMRRLRAITESDVRSESRPRDRQDPKCARHPFRHQLI